MSFVYKNDVFISFNSKDASIAEYIWEYLEKNGLKVFFSDKNCIGKESFEERINEGLESSRDFLLILSNADYVKAPSSDNRDGSHWVADEIEKFIIINNKRYKQDLSRGRLISLRTSNVKLDDLPLDFQKDSTAVVIDDHDETKSYEVLLSFFRTPDRDITNYSEECFIKDYFTYLDKYCGQLKIPSTGSGYEHGKLIDLYVSVPTDRKISIEVKNEFVTKVCDNYDCSQLLSIDKSEYSSLSDALNRNVAQGIEYKYPNPENRPKILSHVWEDGVKRDFWVLNAMDSIAVNSELVLLGDPGTGKSTVLRYLALRLGNQYFSKENVLQGEILSDEFFKNRYFPVYIEVKDFTVWVGKRKGLVTSLNDIASFICHRIVSNYHNYQDEIYKLLCKRSIFIFDGLDEISPDNNSIIRDLLRDIQERSKDSKIVLACRSKEYINWDFSRISTVTLKSMDAPVMEKLAENIFNSFQKHNDSERLFEYINRNKIDLSVYGVPLFFSLMVGLYIEENRVVGTNKSTVLNESVNLLLNRKYHYIGKSSIDYDDILSSVEEIAFEIQKNTNNNSSRISRRDISGIIGEYLSDIPYDTVIRFLKDKAGIITDIFMGGSIFFEFTNRHFQDYLCASYISKQRTIDAVNILADAFITNPLHWIEVFGLYIDIMHDKKDYDQLWAVMSRLIAFVSDEKGAWVVWFVCKALASNEYILLPEKDPQFDDRNYITLNKLKGGIEKLLKEDTVLPLMYKKDCIDALGIMEPDREGTGLKNSLPDHCWCEIKDRGPFVMGLTDNDIQRIKKEDWGKDATFIREIPAKTVVIQPFLISKYPTTNRQFMAFVNAEDGYLNATWWMWSSYSMCWFEKYATKERAQTFYGFTKNKDNYPITNVSCYEAVAYCKWLSYHSNKIIRLPTEGEWEYASKERYTLFQWGESFDPTKCNSSRSGLQDIVPVGLFGEKDTEPSEMNGNIWEWCQSVYPSWEGGDESLTCYDETSNFIDTNENYNVSTDIKVAVRGGSFLNPPALQTNTFRGRDFMSEAFYRQGFRVIQELKHHSVIIPEQYVCEEESCAISKKGCGQSIRKGDTVRLAYKVYLNDRVIESRMTPDEAIEVTIGDGSLNSDIENVLVKDGGSVGTTIEQDFKVRDFIKSNGEISYFFWIYVQEKK